jgi:phage-related minor tail protein
MVGANGGIAMGGFRAFANGGVVNKPTLGLIGEGRYNEAVVPLPDGKSIPVIMQTGGGDRNNIGININVNSNGQMQADAQATGERGVAMAQAIQNVVQLELKRQKRPGGLLSPF